MSFFFSMTYTESTFLMLSLAAFLAARKGKWLIASLCGMCLSATRPHGFLIALPLFLEYLQQWGKSEPTARTLFRPPLFLLGLIPLGLVAFMAFGYFELGSFFAFMHAHKAGWEQKLASPWHTITGLDQFAPFYRWFFAGALVMGFRRAPETVSPDAKEEARPSKVIRTLRHDHCFLMLIIATFLAYAAYAQVESTLVQYLNLTGSKEGVGLVTALIATNGLTIIVFQFPLLRLLRAYDLYVRIYAGLVLFIAGFVIYVFLPIDSYPGWILGTWVLSMGEAVLFPTLNLQADRMASGRLRGSYFGALTLSNLGFAAGPLIGGVMLQAVGGPKTFAFTVLIIILGGLSYWQSSRMAVPARICAGCAQNFPAIQRIRL
jgi:hypothetical protein